MLNALALVLGIDLGQIVPEDSLAERYHQPPQQVTLLTPAEAEVGEWYAQKAPALPAFLDNVPGDYAVQLDRSGRALSVHAQFKATCDPVGAAVLEVLQNKYGVPSVPEDAERRDFDHQVLQVSYRCSSATGVQLGYLHKRSFGKASKAHSQRHAAVVREAQAMEKGWRLQQANRLALGNRARLHGALGIRFDEAVELDRLRASLVPAEIGELADLSVAAPAPFSDATIKVKMRADRKPYHVEAEIESERADQLFQELAAAFAVKYGSPYTGGKRRRVHRVNGDLLSISSRANRLRLLAVQGTAAREAAAEIKAQAAEDYQRKTAGL